MPDSGHARVNTGEVLAVIMGGGRGTRLFPLTKERAKPAVPLGGKYRIVDIPISNCINSQLRAIYLLTQFNSASLHRHISQSYKFDHFNGGFVEILAAEQTNSDDSWYEGTADAVRKNMVHFRNIADWKYLLILSGDQLYNADFQHIVGQHRDTGAEVTIATIPVGRSEASSLGIMQMDGNRRITRFEEKPKDPAVQDSLRLDPALYHELGLQREGDSFLASMGIYVFNRDVIEILLQGQDPDFGKHIIPRAIHSHQVFSYVFQGYWEDIGTIRAFFEANIELCNELPRFNFFNMLAPIFTRPRFLPGSKINGAQIDHAVISDGCIINHAVISQSIVGLRCNVEAGTYIHRCILMGTDNYEAIESIQAHEAQGKPRIGIGKNCRIENTIVDKNARIGDNVRISPDGKPENVDHELYYIRDGIVIIPKNGVIPSGTVI